MAGTVVAVGVGIVAGLTQGGGDPTKVPLLAAAAFALLQKCGWLAGEGWIL